MACKLDGLGGAEFVQLSSAFSAATSSKLGSL